MLDEPDKRDFFAGIDVFALPSRSDSFGLVLLEAWANGVPNVAYRAGGVPGVIRHEQDGLLVRCGDVERTGGGAAAAGRGCGAGGRDWARAGRARLPREFRWEDKLELVRRVYQDVVQPSEL